MAANFHIPLAAERRALAGELQSTLVDLLDLTLIGKHAHWNVEGRLFRSEVLATLEKQLSMTGAQVADCRSAGSDAAGLPAATTNGGHRS